MAAIKSLLLSAFLLSALYAQNDWQNYGGDPGSTRYSSLSQINTTNASKLAQAWVFDTRPDPSAPARPGRGGQSQTTPLVVNGVMYVLTPHQTLVALDPETGKPIWVYKHSHAGRPPRGIAYWPGDKENPARILFGTFDGFLVAVDVKTGKAIPGFGKQGEIDLKAGMKDPAKYPNSHYGLSGAAMVYKNVVIVGSHTQDAPSLGPPGDARGFDVRTGKLVWTFHSIPRPGEVGHETWLNDGWQERSGVNAWTTGSIDTKTGAVFMCFDSPATDLYGGDRPGTNLFGNTLVALDALTGKLKWYFQTTHHDIWDYDEPGTPSLVDVKINGKTIPAIVETGKTGLVFVLDRATGKPLLPVEERPVPKGDVPGEWYSPTQPFPVKTPPLTRFSITRDELAKVTPEQQKYCEALWDADGGAHNDGPYTPMGMKPTVVFPGADGGGSWSGVSVDPKLGYMFQNVKNDGAIGMMSTRGGRGQTLDPGMYARQGIQMGDRRVGSFSNPETGWPCNAPPWGELSAVNLSTGEVAWRIPFGRVDELEAKGVMNTGSFNKGGSVATAGGVLFIGATYDSRFHVFESKTGRLLWEKKLMAQAQANPITYEGKNGKQYVAVDADDYIVAFALP